MKVPGPEIQPIAVYTLLLCIYPLILYLILNHEIFQAKRKEKNERPCIRIIKVMFSEYFVCSF
jgi:hypothetical protein